jgi:hypothetical protein
MLQCVCAVGSPALGESLSGGGVPVVPELLERVADAEVARQERVRIA